MTNRASKMRIVVTHNGPYLVKGGIPLVRKSQVVSEFGEPLTWKVEGSLETPDDEYALCRCGRSGHKPFCDGTHAKTGFVGTETANTEGTAEHQRSLLDSPSMVVKKDPTLCMNSGFCALRQATLEQILAKDGDPRARLLALSMIERCPSGSLIYALGNREPTIEPDLPAEISDTTEITSAGPIAGPLWVTGRIPIERSDGRPFETRNRVTLCNCGHSSNRPLCDGTHRREAERLGRSRAQESRKGEGSGKRT